VSGYNVALFFHLIFMLLAGTAAALAMYAALRLRTVESPAEAGTWLRFTGRVVPLFPIAVLGLLATGAYMTHARWSWSLPWIQAAVAGLGLIVALGSGVEAGRGRALRRELETAGLSPRARRLLRDPVAWSARLMTQTLAVAVMFVMTVKPGAVGSASALAAALIAGGLTAVPFWRTGPARGVSAARPERPAVSAP
jgi:hypothetical protein